jgi:hypothetical protein
MDQELSSAHITQEQARRPEGSSGCNRRTERPTARSWRRWAEGGGAARWSCQVAVDLTQEQQVLARHRVWVYTVLAAAVLL